MRSLVAVLLAAPARAFVAPAARSLAPVRQSAPPPLHASPVDLAAQLLLAVTSGRCSGASASHGARRPFRRCLLHFSQRRSSAALANKGQH